MSDLLTHWAVFDDCRRLAQCDARIEPLFARLLQEAREFARLGALTRGGSKWVPTLLKRARTEWNHTDDRLILGRKVAFALGGIAHYAADITLKPLMSEAAQADWNASHSVMQGHAPVAGDHQNPDAIREVSAYYDVQVFREVYLHGQAEPFSQFLTAANTSEPGQALEAFVRALFQRALLSAHTLDPDRENIDGWLDRLFAKVQPLYIDINLYTQVFDRPDPEKMRNYRVETGFYTADDPIVMAARRVQTGEPLEQPTLDDAVAWEANRGGYGRAVALGMICLREASDYWQGVRATAPDLKQAVRWTPKTDLVSRHL